jgi:hypothetical protein
LSLRRAAEKERSQDRCRTETYEHTGPLSANFLQRIRFAYLAARIIGCDATTGEPL